MSESDLAVLRSAIQNTWTEKPSAKAARYVGAFFDGVRVGTGIRAKVVGNHGTYIVSIKVNGKDVVSACSCYIGKGGYCHHCEALAATFLRGPAEFIEIKPKKQENIQSLDDVHEYLQGITLADLLQQLSEKGITQKGLAGSIGMNPRHLSAIKSSEARHHYFNELGATKLACLWVLEHAERFKSK